MEKAVERTINDLVYVGFNSRVVAIDRFTGERVWDWKSPEGSGFVSLLLDVDRLIVSVMGYMYCLDPLFGQEVWRNPLKGLGTGVACLASAGGTQLNAAAAAAYAAKQQKQQAAAHVTVVPNPENLAMSYNVSRGKPLLTSGVGIDASELPPYEQGRIDPRAWFAQPALPFEIEIGSGKGTFLVQEAAQRSGVNFLGIESAAAFYKYAADRLRRHQFANVRMLRGDAVEFIRYWCADTVADVIHLYFSDPWPKSRHHKRRVVQDESLAEFHRVLGANGALHLVTDHAELAQWYDEHAERHQHLFERCAFVPPASAQPGEIVGTNYERKFAVEGRTIRALTLRKR